MLVHLLPVLSQQRLVLASSSPRRAELLHMLGLQFEVCASTYGETLDKSRYTPAAYVMATARFKALEVASRLETQASSPSLIIAADTVVVLDGVILEKPRDTAHATAMLRCLSGREHDVYTGVTLVRYTTGTQGEPADVPEMTIFSEQTRVVFAQLPEEVIAAYVASGEPMDKAGGYGIQGMGSTLVERISGCYFNVVGFPVHAFSLHLADMYA